MAPGGRKNNNEQPTNVNEMMQALFQALVAHVPPFPLPPIQVLKDDLLYYV